MPRNVLIALALGLPLAACGGAGGAVNSAASKPPVTASKPKPVRAPVRRAPLAPQVQSAPGLEAVIGAVPADLVRQFGPARLDVWEGDARKLQFSGPACVLDVFLYPAAAGREPQATYVEARRASDGLEVDRAACVTALRGR